MILLISPEPWAGHSVSKHHYAIELARRGHEVLFLGPPSDGSTINLERVSWHGAALTVVHSPRLLPGLRFLPAVFRRNVEKRWLQSLEKLVGKQIAVIWLFENSRFFDMNFAGRRLKIYHQVDLNQDFHPETAAATSDLTIAISQPIERRLMHSAKRMIRVTHGCPSFLRETKRPNKLDEFFVEGVVHVVLTGNMDLKYLDVCLVEELVDAHPGVRFHFVGSYTIGTGLHAAVGEASNAIFWGRQPSEDLPSILRRADVLLVTYLADEYLDQLANPHKIMEYLASGRCVLATRTLEYEEHRGIVEIAKNREEFRRRFAEIVAFPSSWNTLELIKKRQAFAADNTYSRQLDRIAEALGPKGYLIS